MGPLLFLTYILDISEGMKANIKGFANDAKSQSYIQNKDDVEDLLKYLKFLYKLVNDNHTTFIGSK